jgi:hypothetical protein
VRRIALALLVIAAAGCKDSTGPATPNLSGRWTGVVAGLTLDVTITDSNQTLSGGGSLSGGNASLPVNLTGTHRDTAVVFSLSATGFQGAFYNGRVISAIRVEGHLSGSGFQADLLDLDKSK